MFRSQGSNIFGQYRDSLVNQAFTGDRQNIGFLEQIKLRRVMKSRYGVDYKYSKSFRSNAFDIKENVIYIKDYWIKGKFRTQRGVFFEETQHAIDQFTNPALNNKKVLGNIKLHAGTFERMSRNTLFDLSQQEADNLLAISARLRLLSGK